MSYKYQIPKRQRPGKEYTQEELYREYYPIVLKLLIMKKKDIMDAEDIAQNVFLYLLEMWKDINWDMVENLISIVLYQRVVRYYQQNDMDDNITSGSDYVELLDSKSIRDPFEAATLDDFRKVLQESFSLLSKVEREVFFGYYLENKSVKELMGNKSIGRIVTPLARARSKVAYFFKKHYPE